MDGQEFLGRLRLNKKGHEANNDASHNVWHETNNDASHNVGANGIFVSEIFSAILNSNLLCRNKI